MRRARDRRGRVGGIVCGVAAVMLALPLGAAQPLQVAGRVMSAKGPVSGCRVFLYHEDSVRQIGMIVAETRSDGRGGFTLAPDTMSRVPVLGSRPPADRLWAAVLHPRYAVAWRTVKPGETGCEVALSPGVSVQCMVLDPKDRPVAGARVRLVGRGGTEPAVDFADLVGPKGLADVLVARTDGNGIAILRGVPRGTVTIRAGAEGWAETTIDARNTRQAILKLAPGPRIVGRVAYTENGRPAAGAFVLASSRALGSLRSDPWTRTDANGGYVLDVLKPRRLAWAAGVAVPGVAIQRRRRGRQAVAPRLLLRVLTPDPKPTVWAEPVWVEAGEPKTHRTDIALRPGAVIGGRVRSRADDAPIPGAVVRASSYVPGERVPRRYSYARTDAEGRYQICVSPEAKCYVYPSNLPPRGWAMGDEWRSERGVKERAERNKVIDFALDLVPAVPMTIRALDPGGTPLPGASVISLNVALASLTGDDGRVVLRSCPRGGRIRAYLTSRDRRLAHFLDLAVPHAPPAEPIDVQLQPTRTVTIRVQDEAGAPVADARVLVDVKLAPHMRGFRTVGSLSQVPRRTDAQGRCRVAGLLPEQPFFVQVFPVGGPRQLRLRTRNDPPVRFRAADENPEWVFTLKRGARFARAGIGRRGALAPPKPSLEDQIKALGKIEWQKKDPLDADLTWIVLPHAIALANKKDQVVTPYYEFFDYDEIKVQSIAFTREAAWMGTNKGAFSWSRQYRFWNRHAVGGYLIEAPVREITVRPDGLIEFRMKPHPGRANCFLYDASKKKWTEAE